MSKPKTGLVRPTTPAEVVSGQKSASGQMPDSRLIPPDAVLREAIKAFEHKSIAGPSLTENGAIVIYKALLLRLNSAAERRIGLAEEGSVSFAGATFEAGSWAQTIRIANARYRIKHADPLDSLSREVWYRVTCK